MGLSTYVLLLVSSPHRPSRHNQQVLVLVATNTRLPIPVLPVVITMTFGQGTWECTIFVFFQYCTVYSAEQFLVFYDNNDQIFAHVE